MFFSGARRVGVTCWFWLLGIGIGRIAACRKVSVLLFALATACCAGLPAEAQGRLAVRVVVFNTTGRALTLETSRVDINPPKFSFRGNRESFTVPSHEARVAPITDTITLWIAIRPCPGTIEDGLVFYNPLLDYPDVRQAEDGALADGHNFGEGDNYYYWRERIKVGRFGDGRNHKEFQETILHAPACG